MNDGAAMLPAGCGCELPSFVALGRVVGKRRNVSTKWWTLRGWSGGEEAGMGKGRQWKRGRGLDRVWLCGVVVVVAAAVVHVDTHSLCVARGPVHCILSDAAF